MMVNNFQVQLWEGQIIVVFLLGSQPHLQYWRWFTIYCKYYSSIEAITVELFR